MNRQTATINDISNESKNGNFKSGKVLVNQIVDDICQLYQGRYEQSDSQVESEMDSRSRKRFVDSRLQYWKDMLRQRRALQLRLYQNTGKQPEDILFNLEYHKDQTIKRVLDDANYSEMTSSSRTMDSQQVSMVKLQNFIKIGRSPKRANLEMLRDVTKKNAGKSNSLGSYSQAHQTGGDSSDFCPDFSKLKVIGKNRWHNIVFGLQSLHTISSISSIPGNTVSNENVKSNMLARETMTETLSVLINGTTYRRYKPEYSPILERMFVCNPYERNLRTIMRIENNGQHPLSFMWKRSDFFAYNNTLFNTKEEVFIFDAEPFELRSGEVREVVVLFRPSEVGITKQRWLLTTMPKIFYRCPMALTLNMHGRCTPPQEYLELIESQMELPIRYCDQSSASSALKTRCPFVRELGDCETFNRRNVGFHCESHNDIEDVKKFFAYLKPETSPLRWDYSVSMLIDLVCSKNEEVLRIELFEKLINLLEKLRGRSVSLTVCDGQAKLAERSRTRLIFVRGIIANNIDLWEEKIWSLESQMLKASQFKEYKRNLIYLKPFRDSIYMYTYAQLCSVVEDIVSVIESTEHV